MNSDSDLGRLLKKLSELALEKKAQLITAESCTGGLIAAALTELPGSSAWVAGGFVTYSCEQKRRVLGVKKTTLTEYGAVSAECVSEMLSGALERSEATLAVAASGVAGPSGDGSENPVGTVYLGWRLKGQEPLIKRFYFPGDRSAVRKSAVLEALSGCIALLEKNTEHKG